jgi:hypothetical protein
MTNQEMIDWAFAQDPDTPEQKLMLIGLAYSAGPEGGGHVALEKLASFASTKAKDCRTDLDLLARRGLVIYELTNDVVTFGLNIARHAS